MSSTCAQERFTRLRTATLGPQFRFLERVMGIEPTSSAWKAEVLPLNYTRLYAFFRRAKILTVISQQPSGFSETRCIRPLGGTANPVTHLVQIVSRGAASRPELRGHRLLLYWLPSSLRRYKIVVEGVGFEPT